MASRRPSRRSPPIRRAGRRVSRDVGDHIGFVFTLVENWKRTKRLEGFEFDEIVSVSLIEAERVLRTKYDPKKGTVTTYLSRYLFGFVQYRLLKNEGKRKTPNGWIPVVKTVAPSGPKEFDPATLVGLEDLFDRVHPSLRPILRRLSEGDDLEEIARELLLSFDATPRRREKIEALTESLRRDLRTELRRFLYDD